MSLVLIIYEIDACLVLYRLCGDKGKKRRSESLLLSAERLLTRIDAKSDSQLWALWLDYREKVFDADSYFNGDGFAGLRLAQQLHSVAFMQSMRMKEAFPEAAKTFDI